MRAHLIDGARKRTKLVRKARAELSLETALLDRRRRVRDASDPPGDEHGDDEPDERADQCRAQGRVEYLVADNAQRVLEIRSVRDRDDSREPRAAGDRKRHRDGASLVVGLDVPAPRERFPERVLEVEHVAEVDADDSIGGDQPTLTIEHE